MGKFLTLLANIRLGWKGLLRTNTLAYYERLQITDVKSFITMGPEGNRTNFIWKRQNLEFPAFGFKTFARMTFVLAPLLPSAIF